MRVIERSNQRLNDGDGAIEAARISPGFEVMRFRHVPLAIVGGLIEMRVQMNGVSDFAQLGGEIEIVRRVVNGIAADNQ